MIHDRIEEAIKESFHDPLIVKFRNLLRLVKSEIQQAAYSQPKPLTEQQEINIVKKIIKSNKETIALINETSKTVELNEECNFLSSFLPNLLSQEETLSSLQNVDISNCKSIGQAMGLCMNFCKKNNLHVDPVVVKTIVEERFGC